MPHLLGEEAERVTQEEVGTPETEEYPMIQTPQEALEEITTIRRFDPKPWKQ